MPNGVFSSSTRSSIDPVRRGIRHLRLWFQLGMTVADNAAAMNSPSRENYCNQAHNYLFHHAHLPQDESLTIVQLSRLFWEVTRLTPKSAPEFTK